MAGLLTTNCPQSCKRGGTMPTNDPQLDLTPPPKPNGADAHPSAEAEFDLSKYAYKAPSGGAIRREQLTIPEGRPKDVFFRIDAREHMQLPVSILEVRPPGRLSAYTYI